MRRESLCALETGDKMELEKYEAKLRFAKAFVELALSEPVDKITVGQIVEAVGKSRKTFYYHFVDKADLVQWLFRYDIACELGRFFHEDNLVFGAEGDDERYAEMPFYVRHIAQDGTIDNAMFFEIFSRSLEKHREYYRRLFSHVGIDTLDSYLHRIYTPCIKDDIWYLIDRELSLLGDIDAGMARRKLERNSSVDFLADFFTGAFVSRVIMRIHDERENRNMFDIAPFENVIHESLQLMISKHLGSLDRD